MFQRKWWQRYSPAPSSNSNVATLKKLIWFYLLLWIFEGALRKWILPSFSAQLLLIRDPIALLIILYAMGQSIWRPNLWIFSLCGIGALSFMFTLGLNVPVPVAVIGLRTLCLHFPLIFIIGKVLTRADVEQVGNIVLDLSLPMGLLMALQFAAPEGSFINAGAGAEATQITGGEGRIRAPAVFSFISGAAQYFALTTAFLLARIVSQGKQSLLLLIGSTAGVVLAVSMAISRTLSISVGLVVVAFVIACLRSGIPLRKLLPSFVIVSVVAIMLTSSVTVRTGLEAFVDRWTAADSGEGSIVVRGSSGYWVNSYVIASAGVAGHGLGVGTNMGAKLMTGEVTFLLGEGEWDRLVMEMGVILGVLAILWRIGVTVLVGLRCAGALIRKDVLPIVLFVAAAPNMLNGQAGIATTLGYIAISLGLAIASVDAKQQFGINRGKLLNEVRQQVLPGMRRQKVSPHKWSYRVGNSERRG